MATYFGEVLPLTSRAVEDEDDDEFPCETDEKIIISSHNDKAKCSTLLVAIGPIACGFCQAYLFTTETQQENSISLSNQENEHNDLLAEIFSVNDQLNVCLIPRNVDSEIVFDVTEKVLECLKDDVKVVILTVNHESQFYTTSNKEQVPFLRCLKSSQCLENVSCKVLETPNVVSGLPAAILTGCEVRRMVAILFTLYADVTEVDSVNTESFLPVIRLPLFQNVQINPDAKLKLKQVTIKKNSSIRSVSNDLYI